MYRLNGTSLYRWSKKAIGGGDELFSCNHLVISPNSSTSASATTSSWAALPCLDLPTYNTVTGAVSRCSTIVSPTKCLKGRSGVVSCFGGRWDSRRGFNSSTNPFLRRKFSSSSSSSLTNLDRHILHKRVSSALPTLLVVHCHVVWARDGPLLQLLINRHAIPEQLLGGEVVERDGLVLVHILNGLLNGKPGREEGNQTPDPRPFSDGLVQDHLLVKNDDFKISASLQTSENRLHRLAFRLLGHAT
mmetsp:Transcript_98458/g.263237  ORF Transcript_98458/g.263237 Transcript_98458/m.263237 type:complete len:246 (-) Transcript_98458:82-819(-)